MNDRIKREEKKKRKKYTQHREKRSDNYQTSMISCSARRIFISVDDSLPEALVTGIWENVFKVRGIVFDEDNGSGWNGIVEEK